MGTVETLTDVVMDVRVVASGDGMRSLLMRDSSAAMLELRATSLGLRVVVVESGAVVVVLVDELVDSMLDAVEVEVTVTINGVDVDGVRVVMTT